MEFYIIYQLNDISVACYRENSLYIGILFSSIMKAIRIRKGNSILKEDGFVFIKVARITNYEIVHEPLNNQVIMQIFLEDKQEVIRLESQMSLKEKNKFMQSWNLFIINMDYFFDLADFKRIL